jgi:hypothetical protein
MEFALGSSSPFESSIKGSLDDAIFIPQFTARKPEKVLSIFLLFNQSKPKKKDLEPSLPSPKHHRTKQRLLTLLSYP